MTSSGIDHVVVAGTHARAVKPAAVAADAKGPRRTTSAARSATRAPPTAVMLADVLDRAQARRADRGHAPRRWLRRLALAHDRRPCRLAARRSRCGSLDERRRFELLPVPHVARLPRTRAAAPARPDPPEAPPSIRSEAWKFGFVGSRCTRTASPPAAAARLHGRRVDQMGPRPWPTSGTIVTFTVDRLAYSLSPPVVAAVIDFDGAAGSSASSRTRPGTVAIGDRVG